MVAMRISDWFKPNDNYLKNSFLLAVLNGAIALFCIVSFMGVLFVTAMINDWIIANSGLSATIPFPAPILLLIYPFLFIAAWIFYARSLPDMLKKEILLTSIIGTTPLILLSLFGFACVAWMIMFGDFKTNSMLDTSVFVYSVISIIIMLATICNVFIVVLAANKKEIESV